jgi:hypothetical protein
VVYEEVKILFQISQIFLQAKTRKLSGVSEAPEDIRSTDAEATDQKVLGETLKAVKPCLEEYAQDQKPVVQC